MRYAPRIGKISMFISFFVSFLENNENVLLRSVLHFTRIVICGHMDPLPQVRTYAPTSKETTARGDRHATVAKTATVLPVCSAQSPDRIAAVTLGTYTFQWLKSPRQLAAFGWLAPFA